MQTYNIRIVELTSEDLQKAATNGGLSIPISPETRSITIKGIVQKDEKKDGG